MVIWDILFCDAFIALFGLDSSVREREKKENNSGSSDGVERSGVEFGNEKLISGKIAALHLYGISSGHSKVAG